MGQGVAQTRCWSQLREKVVEYWWLAVAGAILAYPVLHRANMYWSYRWYHKTKQEKMTWSWLWKVFNSPSLHSVEDWYHASNRPWNQNDPHTGDKIHSTTYIEDRQVFWIVVWIPFGECWLDNSELTTDVITNKTIGFWFLWQTCRLVETEFPSIYEMTQQMFNSHAWSLLWHII